MRTDGLYCMLPQLSSSTALTAVCFSIFLFIRTASLPAAGRPDGWGFQEIAAGRVSPFKAQVIGLLHAVQYLRGMGCLTSRGQLSVGYHEHTRLGVCVSTTRVFSMYECGARILTESTE